jgi:hypothetical protein
MTDLGTTTTTPPGKLSETPQAAPQGTRLEIASGTPAETPTTILRVRLAGRTTRGAMAIYVDAAGDVLSIRGELHHLGTRGWHRRFAVRRSGGTFVEIGSGRRAGTPEMALPTGVRVCSWWPEGDDLGHGAGETRGDAAGDEIPF